MGRIAKCYVKGALPAAQVRVVLNEVQGLGKGSKYFIGPWVGGFPE